MAQTSSSKLIDITVPNDSFTCGVCLADFSNPRNLSCGHIFCLACLEQIHQAKKLKCPVCRKVTVMKASVADLGEPVLLKNLQQRAKEVGRICEVCRLKADMYCSDCKSFLCQPCAEKHKARFPGHKCHHQEDVIFCDAHPKQPVTKFCSPCDKCICNLCEFSDHQQHDTRDIEDAYAETLARFDSVQEEQARQPSIEVMEKVKQSFKYEDLISTATRIKEQSKMLTADLRDILQQISIHSEQQISRWGQFTEAIQLNKNAIERGKTVENADMTPGKSLIDMQCVLDSFKSENGQRRFYHYTVIKPKEDLRVLLTELMDLRERLGLRLNTKILSCRKHGCLTLHAADKNSDSKADLSESDVAGTPLDDETPFGGCLAEVANKRSYSFRSYEGSPKKRRTAPRAD